ncbi:MAG: Ig-like domain-containing protein [Planctomycetota bacterium]
MTIGDLALLESSPADDAVQVAVDSSLWLRFDGVLVRDCLTPENVWLTTAAGSAVAAATSLAGAGREVTITPSALAPETDYELHLSPFVCDTNGRILADSRTIRFRTLDQRPPALSGASVADAQTGVDRLANFVLTFDEALAPASIDATTVYLRDVFGSDYPCALTLVDGYRVVVDPLADLAGNRRYVLAVAGGARGLTDRAGNVLAQGFRATFTTAPDTTAPLLQEVWPPQELVISPLARPEIVFNESVDPASIEPNSVALVDDFSNVYPLRIAADPSKHRLRLVPSSPLPKGVGVRLSVAGGAGALTDLSGNTLGSGSLSRWTVGNDDAPPAVVQVHPAIDAERVSLNVRPHLTFDEPLDSASVHAGSVVLRDAQGGVVAGAVLLTAGATGIEVVPTANLRRATTYTLVVRGGGDGVRDRAGNTLSTDLEFRFRAADDATLPEVILLPADGATAVPTDSHVSAVFDSPVDASTVSTDTLFLSTRNGTPVAGDVEVVRGGRAARFTPRSPLLAGTWYRLTLRGGIDGVREISGNWLGVDEVHEFRTGFDADIQAPTVRVSLNAAADLRKQGMQVPASGFTIDVYAQDPGNYAFDPSSFEVTLLGLESGPTADQIYALATVTRDRLSWRVPTDRALPPGEYRIRAAGRDLSGNLGEAETVSFTVVAPRADKVPFERTHVVWVRTDLDRDGNGRSDFVDDLTKLGFVIDGDPRGTNQRMIDILRAGIVAQAHHLFDRSASGAAQGDGSVAIRFTDRRPAGVAHMQIALGGLDPEAPRQRDYGDESSGVLGRAFFDAYNRQTNDLNIGTNPGLGVFPGELFLFQASIHRRVYPAFITSFARRFLNLAPAMGGTPVGSGDDDAIVVAAGFDYVRATSEQRLRYDAIFRAADEWATAVGIVLAHEVGHSVGLVAEGPSPLGLYGDASLHDEAAGVADVMAPAVGYDSLIQLDYAFRDLDLAYLRQRLILK